jgi:hypothetical protein
MVLDINYEKKWRLNGMDGREKFKSIIWNTTSSASKPDQIKHDFLLPDNQTKASIKQKVFVRQWKHGVNFEHQILRERMSVPHSEKTDSA